MKLNRYQRFILTRINLVEARRNTTWRFLRKAIAEKNPVYKRQWIGLVRQAQQQRREMMK